MAIKRNPDAVFGLFDHSMLPKINRLLKPYGLRLSIRSCYAEWGDQVEISVTHPNGHPIKQRRQKFSLAGVNAGN